MNLYNAKKKQQSRTHTQSPIHMDIWDSLRYTLKQIDIFIDVRWLRHSADFDKMWKMCTDMWNDILHAVNTEQEYTERKHI